jgi:hypothetical protein
MLRVWLVKFDLARLRDEEALATLPDAERRAWEAFWEEVRRTIAAAREVR